MKSISIFKLNFRKPRFIKIVCDGFGCSHSHYIMFFSLAELSSSLNTLRLFGFHSVSLFLQNRKGEFNINVEL